MISHTDGPATGRPKLHNKIDISRRTVDSARNADPYNDHRFSLFPKKNLCQTCRPVPNANGKTSSHILGLNPQQRLHIFMYYVPYFLSSINVSFRYRNFSSCGSYYIWNVSKSEVANTVFFIGTFSQRHDSHSRFCLHLNPRRVGYDVNYIATGWCEYTLPFSSGSIFVNGKFTFLSSISILL